MTTTTTKATFVDAVRTILGPLTTTFTPPATCGYVAVPPASNGPAFTGWRAQECASDGEGWGNGVVSQHLQSFPRVFVVQSSKPTIMSCRNRSLLIIDISTGGCDGMLASHHGRRWIADAAVSRMGLLLPRPHMPSRLHQCLQRDCQRLRGLACTIPDASW